MLDEAPGRISNIYEKHKLQERKKWNENTRGMKNTCKYSNTTFFLETGYLGAHIFGGNIFHNKTYQFTDTTLSHLLHIVILVTVVALKTLFSSTQNAPQCSPQYQ
jgi:hypothetical protein